jgi:hypothetical protein
MKGNSVGLLVCLVAYFAMMLPIVVVDVDGQTISVPMSARPSSTRMGTNVGSRPSSSRVTDPTDGSADGTIGDAGMYTPSETAHFICLWICCLI